MLPPPPPADVIESMSSFGNVVYLDPKSLDSSTKRKSSVIARKSKKQQQQQLQQQLLNTAAVTSPSSKAYVGVSVIISFLYIYLANSSCKHFTTRAPTAEWKFNFNIFTLPFCTKTRKTNHRKICSTNCLQYFFNM